MILLEGGLPIFASGWGGLTGAKRAGAYKGHDVKNILKAACLMAAHCLPDATWDRYVAKFSMKPRSRGKISHAYERIVNYLNREIVSERAFKYGVWYQTDSVGKRYDIYDYVFDRHVELPIDYLEFGVYRGSSIRFMLEKVGPESNVYGFDSFEGLPEDWYHGIEKGEFKVANAPQVGNAKVRFVKGWFEDSLKPFLDSTNLKKNLVLHMDADLYSSTIYVLRALEQHIVPGTIVIFDEYWFVKDEFRAFGEFVSEGARHFEYIAISETRAAVRFLH